MIRTFIAIEVPDEIRRRLAPDLSLLKAAAPLVKWASSENLHLTLRFLGDVKENDLDELFDAIDDYVSGIQPFAIEIQGIGAFPNWRHPRVVWAGCGDGSDEAIHLASQVEAACVDLGYDRDRRPFRPHLTLGRIKEPAHADGLWDAAKTRAGKTFGYIDVDEVVVFMSTLRRTGPVYSPMTRIPL